VSPANQYKSLENQFTDRLVKFLKSIGDGISTFFKRFMTAGKQRFTVMFIPHSEKKIFNFRISVFSLVFLCMLLAGVLVAFFLSSTTFSGVSRLLTKRSELLESTQANLEIIRDEIADLQSVAKKFETSLGSTLNTFGFENTLETGATGGGDLSTIISLEEEDRGVMSELSELQGISALLNESAASLQKITDLLVSQGELLVELPTLWPLEGGRGRSTNPFGPAIHPFTKKWYLHKGVDLAFHRGWPVLVTAEGKVVENKFEPMGFGNYIVVRHKYGFYTKYAHLDRVYVNEGDTVTQGQRIGVLGSTGLSTGPHLHYEVRIGSQVVDPERYLNISSEMKNISGRN
jgi:murein DD-endopeptidase MepM/ murein hydrolase activator NlpD